MADFGQNDPVFGANDAVEFGADDPVFGADDKVVSPTGAKPGGFFRGVKEGFTAGLYGTPESFGAGVEAYGRATGMPSVTSAGEAISEATKTQPPELVPLRDALSAPGTFIGQQIGLGVGSTVPTLVSGAAGATAGGLLAGPPGAAVGALLGSAAPSLPINTGDLYQQLVAEGVDKDRAAALAAPWGVVLTAPDVFSASRLLKPFLGTVSEAGSKGLARLLAQRIKDGAQVEGLTEIGQQGLQETIAAVETGNANLADRAERVAEAGIAGTLGGGTIGGAGAVVERARGPGAPTEPVPEFGAEDPVDTPAPGTVVGVKTADGVERGVIDRVEDGVVYWRDESNAERVDDLADFQRDLADAPEPRGENATTVGEPPADDAPIAEPRPAFDIDVDSFGQDDPVVEPTRRPGDEVAELRAGERSVALDKRVKRERAKMERGDADALTEDEIIALENRGRAGVYDPGPQPRGDEAGIVPRQGELALADAENAAPNLRTELSEERTQISDIDLAAAETNTAPTEAQKESGNYKKGRVEIQGIKIAIENPKGSERSGTDKGGKPWSVKMPAHYGYVERTEGKDGDQVDVYIGDNPDADTVWVVDQIDPETGKFDEHKAFLGFPSQDVAEMTYASAFSDGSGPSRMGGIAAMSVGDFKTWVKGSGAKKPAAESAPTMAKLQPYTQENIDVRGAGDETRVEYEPWRDLGDGWAIRQSTTVPRQQIRSPTGEIVSRGLDQSGNEYWGMEVEFMGRTGVPADSDTVESIIGDFRARFGAMSVPRIGPKLTSGADPTEAYAALKSAIQSVGRAWQSRNLARTAAESTRIPVGSPDSLQRLSAFGRYFSFATGLASRDKPSARLFSAMLDRDRTREQFERAAIPAVKPYMDLPPASQDKVNRVLEHDRMNGVDRRDNGRKIVVQVSKNSKPLDLSKPGDVIKLTAEETAALHAVRKFTDQRLMDLGAAMAREQGYTGEFSEAALKNPEGKEAGRAAQILEAVMAARRSGYIPFNRYGDYYVKILPKPKEVPGKDAMPPSLEDGRFEFVDTGRAWDALLSERAGSSPRKVNNRVKELEAKYPRDKFDYEIGRVTPKQIQSLDIPLIEKLFAAVNMRDHDLGQKLHDEIMNEVYKDRLAGFRKQARNIPGYSTDFERSIADYVRQSSSVIANMDHGKEIEDAYSAIQGGTKDTPGHPDKNVRDFWKAHREHIENGKGDFASLRKFGFFNFLWGSPSSALINLTQTPLVTGFQLGSWAGVGRGQQLANGALYEAMNAIRPSGARGFTLDFDKIGRTPAEKAMLKQLLSEGVLDPVVANELQGADVSKNRSLRPVMRAVNRVYEIGASMFNTAEQANRAAAALAYFRAAQSPDLRKKLAQVYADDQMFKQQVSRDMNPVDIARWGIDETQFIGGKINRQPIQRGVGSLALQFQQYNANYMRLIYKNFTRMGHEGKVAGSLMLISLIAAGGMLGFPFADDILGMAQYAYKTATGIDPLLERRFAQFVADDLGFGSYGAEIALRGPSRLLGVDLSKRVGMGDIAPKNDLMDVAGPVASATFGRAQEVWQRYSTGQPIAASITALQPLIGKGPSDVLRGAVQLPEEGYSTLRGSPVVLPSDITGDEQAARMLGFQPSRFARRTEAEYEDRRLAEATKEASTKLLTRVGREFTLAEDARRRGDMAEAKRYEKRGEALLAENAEQLAGDGPDWSKVPAPTAKSIKERVRRYLEPVESRMKSAPKLKREEMQRGPWVRE